MKNTKSPLSKGDLMILIMKLKLRSNGRMLNISLQSIEHKGYLNATVVEQHKFKVLYSDTYDPDSSFFQYEKIVDSLEEAIDFLGERGLITKSCGIIDYS